MNASVFSVRVEKGVAAVLAAFWLVGAGVEAATQIKVGSTTGAPGFQATIPVALSTETNVAGLQFDLIYDPTRLLTSEVTVGSGLKGQTLASRLLAPGRHRVLIYARTNQWLANGVMVECKFLLAGDAPAGIESVSLANVIVTSALGGRLEEVEELPGSIGVFGGALFHHLEELAWLLVGGPTDSTNVEVVAARPEGSYAVYAGPFQGASPVWNTRAVADGRYQLRVLYRNAAKTAIEEFTRDIVVNNSAVWHGGPISASETWSNGVVHIVESPVIVPANLTLALQPGAVVKFARGVRINVNPGGTFTAMGADKSPIVLTSLSDDSAGGDSNYDGDLTQPKPGDWQGIDAGSGSQVNLNGWVDIRYVVVQHRGALTKNEIWNGTYLHRITDHLVVNADVTLTLQPAGVIKFDLGKRLTVLSGGTILAPGTVAQPITFTSIRDDSVGDDTNQDGNKTQPAAGDWGWIFINGGTGMFDHCQVRYGAGPAEGGWGPSGDPMNTKGMFKTTGPASLSLSNSVLQDAFYDGVLAWGGQVTIVSTILVGIDRAVSAHPGSPVLVQNCTLYNNKIGLLAHGGTLTAENTVVANSLESGIQFDFGSIAAVRYCDVWAPPRLGYLNYRNTADQSGKDGNFSSDPRFKDPGRGNFRLNYGSPCIDAANSLRSPATDLAGTPRFNDVRSVGTGVANASGIYADQGAYEFAEAAASDIDLVATEVDGPLTALAGDLVRIQWVVMNRGKAPVTGPWHDAVYLLDTTGNRRIQAGEALVGQGIILGPGQTYSASANLQVPGGVVQNYRWLVAVNSQGEIFEGRNRANNESASVGEVALDLPLLGIDAPPLTSRFDAPEAPRWFKFRPATNQDIMVVLDLTGDLGVTELYIGKDYMPSPQTFDSRQREWKSADASVLAANVDPNSVYYVLAYPRSLTASSAEFKISARAVDFMVEKVKPGLVGNAGLATLEILGANLRTGTVFKVEAANGQQQVAQRTTYVDSGKVFATFNLTNFPAGKAHILADQAGVKTMGSNLLEIVSGGSGGFYLYLTGPKVIRLGRTGSWYLTYGNKGLVDVPLPLVRVTVPGSKNIKLFESTLNWAESFVMLAMNDRSLLPTLGPGQEFTIGLDVLPGPAGQVTARAEVLSGDKIIGNATSMDWLSIPPPEGVDAALWRLELEKLSARLGGTLSEYYALLMKDLDDLARDYMGHAYVANVNGRWLFGAEPEGVSISRPNIVAPGVDPDLHVDEVQPRQGPARLRTFQIPVKKKGDGIRKTYFVTITDSDYRVAGQSNLNGVNKDQTDMQQYLDKDLRAPSDQIVDLHDGTDSTADDLSRTNVLDAIKKLKGKMDGDDELMIFYSGHGSKQANGKGNMYLNNGEVTPEDFQNAIDEVGAGTTYLVNDSCHAGGLGGNVNPTNSNFVSLSATEYGRVSHDFKSGGFFITRLKKNLRDCNTLQEAFDKARNDVIDTFFFRANEEARQSPILHNKSNVDLAKKPWEDPSGFRQKIAKVFKDVLAYFFGDEIATPVVGSFDPNDKVGPSASGVANYIGVRQVLPYTIYFENKSTAQAAAQEVLVVDQLDPVLDWATFELKSISFNDLKITVPAGLQSYTNTVFVGSDANPVVVRVVLDPASGRATWFMQSQDASTGLLPEDPFAGFLPPNDASHRGEGSVSFTIRSKTNLLTGVRIQNQATIIFDSTYGLNAPIDTPVVHNTIDAAPPASAVNPLPVGVPNRFEVSWSGGDDPNGSGLFAYDVYVSKNYGPYEVWLAGATETNALFIGEARATYQFYTVARDYAGNVETAPLLPDAETIVAVIQPALTVRTWTVSHFTLSVENLVPGAHYAVEQSLTLRPDDWKVALEFNVTNSTIETSVPLDKQSSIQFFRVRLVVTP